MRKLFTALLAAVLFLCSGCADHIGRRDELNVLTIATADSGGTMYPVGSAIAETLSSDTLKINVSASTGSVMNVNSLVNGEVDLALVSGDVARDACLSSEENESALRAIAAVYVSQSNWLALESSGAVYVHDLAGLRAGIGPQNSSSELAAQTALEVMGLSSGAVETRNCGLGEGGELVLSGELDAIHGFTGAPINGLAELADQTPCRILRYTDRELADILERDGLYMPVTLPAGTYTGQKQDIQTFGVKCLLCVNGSMDEDTAYMLTKNLWEHREELKEKHFAMQAMTDGAFLYENMPITLHPGAQKFYAANGAVF